MSSGSSSLSLDTGITGLLLSLSLGNDSMVLLNLSFLNFSLSAGE